MRSLGIQALVAAGSALLVFSGGVARADDADAWVAHAEALAHRIQADNLIMTDRVRAERERDAARATGRARLQILYDLTAEDYVASSTERVAHSMPAFEREIAAQHDVRYAHMAAMLRAYAPALDGDYVASRRNLEAALQGETDPYVIAVGERFRSYNLTDLGLVGNALEAARLGLAHLPEDAMTLRSGLFDSLSYVSIRIGDVESGFEHMQRSVDLDERAGKPIDGMTVIYNVSSMLADHQMNAAALRLQAIHQDIASHLTASGDRFFGDLLCAKVNLATLHYARVVQCADEGRAIAGAPQEYMTRLLLLRAQGLARLRQARAARQAVAELRTIAAQRGDPALVEKINAIEPEVLRAEGRITEAYDALSAYHENSERNVLRRFNAGVKELRATMENEITRADERSDLQAKAMQGMTLTILLAGLSLAAAVVIAWLIYRSRRNMLAAVGQAESILARRVGGEAGSIGESTKAPTSRLRAILGEIEHRDAELKQAFHALESARAAAEEASLAKSQFLTTMSHELRTPLNAIIGYSEILMENAEQTEAWDAHSDLTRIRGAGHRLLLMINDLLDLSKIEAGRMSAESAGVDVTTLLDDIIATVAPTADLGGNTVRAEFERPFGGAYTDGFKLSQCLLNLLSNALKFTQCGDVTLKARREMRRGADWLIFDVIDTGIGISPEAQARLFQPFVQADATITRAHGGTGLGLAITRRLAQLLGGDVSVVSEMGKGATFTLAIPAALAGAHADMTDEDAREAA